MTSIFDKGWMSGLAKTLAGAMILGYAAFTWGMYQTGRDNSEAIRSTQQAAEDHEESVDREVLYLEEKIDDLKDSVEDLDTRQRKIHELLIDKLK